MDGPPIKLEWLEAVIRRLGEDRPGCHSSVMSLISVLAKYADSKTGERVAPGVRTMAEESGLHHSTVKVAIEWLIGAGLLEHTDTLAAGRRQYRLSFRNGDTPQRQNVSDPRTVGASARVSARVDARNGDTYPRIPVSHEARAVSNGDVEVTDEEVEARAWEIARGKGGGIGLARKIGAEDRALIVAQLRAEKRQASVRAAIDACAACDADGFVDVDDTTRSRCTHPALEVVS